MTEPPEIQNNHQSAVIEFSGGPVSLHIKVRVTPIGILAIGGMVAGILLSTAVLVLTATAVPRRRPLASRIKPR